MLVSVLAPSEYRQRFSVCAVMSARSLYNSYSLFMMGNSIDISLANIWRAWYKFRSGKKVTAELDRFSYYLEENLCTLFADLQKGVYRHGGY